MNLATDIAETANRFIPQQCGNQANPQIHRETTALEIRRIAAERVDILVATP